MTESGLAKLITECKKGGAYDAASEVLDLINDMECDALSHTENEDGEWMTITFTYDQWCQLGKYMEEIQNATK